MQPIIVSQGTLNKRHERAEEIIRGIFSGVTDYANHIDFKLFELPEDKKQISVEQVRELIKEINIKPRISNKKIIWINEAQNLSTEAQNALLKILEEPPEYAQIILTVDHHDNLIPTVLSRCVIKNLALSSRVDANSEEYKESKSEFLNLLSLDVGQKIDWVTDNKNKMKDRDEVIRLINIWEAVLRERMLESIKNDNPEIWKNKIELVQKVKRYIQLNANVSLAIETLLLNI